MTAIVLLCTKTALSKSIFIALLTIATSLVMLRSFRKRFSNSESSKYENTKNEYKPDNSMGSLTEKTRQNIEDLGELKKQLEELSAVCDERNIIHKNYEKNLKSLYGR